MNLQKNIKLILFSLLFLLTTNIYSIEFDDDFDSFLNNPNVNAFLDENEFEFVRKAFDPGNVIAILDEMGIVSILEEDFYLRTNPLNKRNIIDLPNGLFDKTYSYNNWAVGVELFWNNTDRSYFTSHCDAISSILALTEESFLQKLDAAAKAIADFAPNAFSFDPLDAIALFKNGTIQERRIGALIHGQKTIRNINISFKLPFYYLERNFWFTEKEQRIMETNFGVLDKDEADRLQETHMICDKLGFGDTRIIVDYPFSDNERFSSRIGFIATLPFSWALAKGILGNSFEDQRKGYNADFKEMLGYHLDEIFTFATSDNIDQQTEAFNILTKLAYDALDHLAANLLDTPMGNNRHFGIGVVLKSRTPLNIFIKKKWKKHRWADNIFFKSFISLEYLFPATEKRFFTETIDERLLDRLDLYDDTKDQQNMEFIESQIIDKMFPFVYDAQVHPGIVFKWTSKATYEKEKWGIHLGTDTWVKTKEQLYDINATARKRDRLRIEKARRILAYQWKILGSIFYKLERKKRNWLFSLNGDYTLGNSGIGEDFTISLNFEVDF